MQVRRVVASIARNPIHLHRLRRLLYSVAAYDMTRMSDELVLQQLSRELLRGRWQLHERERSKSSPLGAAEVPHRDSAADPALGRSERPPRAPGPPRKQKPEKPSKPSVEPASDLRPEPPALGSYLSSSDYDRIRNGPLGRIRSEADLSDADVVRAMNAQLLRVEATDVDAILATFPSDQQRRARIVLARASGFGSMDSMNALRLGIDPALGGVNTFFSPSSHSLGSSLAYLALKRTFDALPGLPDGTPGSIGDSLFLEPEAVVVLDAAVLERIERNPDFARSLVDMDCQLIEAKGFVGGINMFNSPSSRAIAARTDDLLRRANQLAPPNATDAEFEAAVERVLSEPVISVLARVDPALIDQLHTVDPTAGAPHTSEAISRQLSGSTAISESELAAALEAFEDDEEKALMREMLAHQSEVFSARRFSVALAEQQGVILQEAAARNVAQSDIYYYVPEPDKSFGLIALAHREVTDTPVDRYVSHPLGLAARELGPDTMVVLLDDVAGSGGSLAHPVDAIREQKVGPYAGHILVSPMVSTEMAKDRFSRNYAEGPTAAQVEVMYRPQSMSQGLKESDFYDALSPRDRKALIARVGLLGFRGNGTCIAFPYMAPDNNNLFFAESIAHHFILNKNESASKKHGTS